MFYKIAFLHFVFLSLTCCVSYAETTLSFVGDVMIGSDYPDKSGLAPNEGKKVFEGVKDILLNSDLSFANIEGSIADENTTTAKKSSGRIYAFRMPPYSATRIAEAGFTVGAVANNHARDFGTKGFQQTVQHLTEAGIAVVGDKKGQPSYVKIGDKKIGFLAFYYFSANNDSIQNIKSAKNLIAQTKENCDFLIVSFHGGAEGGKEYRVPKQTEKFYGEDRGDVYKFARAAADAGADAVIGHAPHVLRAMEIYNGTFIAYSMGNFAGYAAFNIRGNGGISAILQLTLSDNMQISSAKVIPIKLINGGIPVVDKDKQAIKKLNDYANQDFPETGVIFDGDGNASISLDTEEK